jgi:hypothetical protein
MRDIVSLGIQGTKKIDHIQGQGKGELTYNNRGRRSYVAWRSKSLRNNDRDLEGEAVSEARQDLIPNPFACQGPNTESIQ